MTSTMPGNALSHGFTASGSEQSTAVVWADVAFGLSFILALGAPQFAGAKSDVGGAWPSFLGVLACLWFMWGLQPTGRDAFGVARWPGATALLFGGAAVGTYLGHGRRGVVFLFAAWALPGLVHLARARMVARQASEDVTMAPDRYHDDPAWYSSDWRRDPDNPAQELGTAGYRLELVGGPLAGRMARLRDSRFRLWLVEAEGGQIAARGTIEQPIGLPSGARLLGSYGFSHGDEAMVWIAAK